MKSVGLQGRSSPSLTVADVRSSPCLTCETSPCCSYLPLTKLELRTLADVDQAAFLLNFESIELTVNQDGSWGVFYRRPCRFLDREKAACTVHDTPQQPDICVNYNPFACWYKKALVGDDSQEALRIDRGRFDWVVNATDFDANRAVVKTPTWEEMRAAFATTPIDVDLPTRSPVDEDATLTQWRAGTTPPRPEALKVLGFADLDRPCDGCDAWCCTTLTFPHGRPRTRANIDFIRFLLGFPGIQIAISDAEWLIVVKTRCRHLDGNRCGVYGKPERPLFCRYYDAHHCSYRPRFSHNTASGFIRVAFEDFPMLADCFRFNENGAVTQYLDAANMRTLFEERLARRRDT